MHTTIHNSACDEQTVAVSFFFETESSFFLVSAGSAAEPRRCPVRSKTLTYTCVVAHTQLTTETQKIPIFESAKNGLEWLYQINCCKTTQPPITFFKFVWMTKLEL
jgi:hypothetical protein